MLQNNVIVKTIKDFIDLQISNQIDLFLTKKFKDLKTIKDINTTIDTIVNNGEIKEDYIKEFLSKNNKIYQKLNNIKKLDENENSIQNNLTN